MSKSRERFPKKEDQDKAQEAFQLIKELILLNPHIDMNQFMGACLSIWTERFYASNCSYEEFKHETMKAINSARKYWDEE